MAKPELRDHRKFLKLKRLLGEPTPHVLGYLDCLWHRGYQTGTAFIGDALDVEAAAEYPGEPGRFAQAAFEAGFLDRDADSSFLIHDLYDHAPKYAQMRMRRKGNAPDMSETVTNVPHLGTTVTANGNECATEPRTENQEPKPKTSKEPPNPPSGGGDVATPTAEFLDAWNEAAQAFGWRVCRDFTPKRVSSLRARLRDPAWRDGWRGALTRAGPIPGLRGQNDRDWIANVDWFLRPGTVTKILEGHYDAWKPKPTGRAGQMTDYAKKTLGGILGGSP